MSGPIPINKALRVTGLSHHKAPISLRERLAFRAADLPKALRGLQSRGFHEAVILSTCNRVEIYSVAGPAPERPSCVAEKGPLSADPLERLREFLSEYHCVPEPEFATALYDHQGVDAIRHLFEVAASLDSQILGETEILSQSKEAYRVSNETGACGPALRGLFERAFFLSKELRADGGISRSQASVSSAAVALAKKLFELQNRKVLVVGTGEMASGIVRSLKAAGCTEIFVASRTQARALEFAKAEGGHPCLMEHLDEYLAKVDIVLVSSAAPHYVIGPKEIQTAFQKRRGRTLCLIDISVPRNVDPEVHKYEDTFLYDIDDLEEVARDGRREREAVAARWRPRLAEEAHELLHCLSDTQPRDTAKKLLEHAAAVRAEIAQEHIRGLDPKAVEALTRALERFQGKLLHGPLETLRQSAREGGGADTAALITRMFKLQAIANAASENGHGPVSHEIPPASQSAKSGVKEVEATRARPVGDNSGDIAIAAH